MANLRLKRCPLVPSVNLKPSKNLWTVTEIARKPSRLILSQCGFVHLYLETHKFLNNIFCFSHFSCYLYNVLKRNRVKYIVSVLIKFSNI